MIKIMQPEKTNLIRNILAVGGLILIFLVPYFYAQNPEGLLPEALLLAYFLPTFFLLSDESERKFILSVLLIASLAETLNVAIGAYTYIGSTGVPNWVLIGWTCTAWALINLNKMIKPNIERNKTLAGLVAIFVLYAIFVSHSIENFFIASFVVSAVLFSIKPKSYNIFIISVLFGMVIEFSGVFLFHAWSYQVGPDLSHLGAMYTFVYFISSLISRYEL